MTLRDAVTSAAVNLWRMKLRSALTISGVVIAIAAFASMMSLAIGMQRLATSQFEELGLLSTLHAYPKEAKPGAPADSLVLLDDAALRRFVAIPGVRLAYPFKDFPVSVTLGDSVVTTTAQALPRAALDTKLFSTLEAGRPFAADTARQVLVSETLLDRLGVDEPEDLVGRTLALETRVASFDSALAATFRGVRRIVIERVHEGWSDSLLAGEYWRAFGREVAAGALTDFMGGLLTARRTVRDTLTVSGVIETRRQGHSRTAALIIPPDVAARLSSGDISDDPADLLAMLRTGALPGLSSDGAGAGYDRVTLDLDPAVPYEPIRDAVQAMGFRTFSYVDEFRQMRRFFLFFKLGLSLVGGIALLMASFGIVNTMVMSIMERTREIGILKALGADDADIRTIFLVESALIGFLGALLGVVAGRALTLVAELVARQRLSEFNFPAVEIFAFPPLLVLGALAFGTVVSLAAGIYPAHRAARIDPIQALRHD